MLTKPINMYAHAEFAQALTNAGYITNVSDFDKQIEDMYAWLGNTSPSNKFVFAVAMTNTEVSEHTDSKYYISLLYIEVNKDGLVVAEWEGMPSHDGMNHDDLEAYFNGVRDARRYIK